MVGSDQLGCEAGKAGGRSSVTKTWACIAAPGASSRRFRVPRRAFDAGGAA